MTKFVGRTVLGMSLAAFSIHRVTAAPSVEPSSATIVDASGNPIMAAPVVKTDPQPNLVGLDTDAEPLSVNFTVPAYDLATSNKLVGITVVIVPKDHGEPTRTEDWLASSYPKGEFDTSALQAGGPVSVDIADVPEGDFKGQVLFTYDQ